MNCLLHRTGSVPCITNNMNKWFQLNILETKNMQPTLPSTFSIFSPDVVKLPGQEQSLTE